jgi:hypothetical protein
MIAKKMVNNSKVVYKKKVIILSNRQVRIHKIYKSLMKREFNKPQET